MEEKAQTLPENTIVAPAEVKADVVPDASPADSNNTKPQSTVVDETVNPVNTEEAIEKQEDMSKMTPAGCPFMRKE
jgi:hypothetical protein